MNTIVLRPSRLGVAATLAALAALQGCALNAPHYQPAIDNVETMKRSGMRSVALGSFSVGTGAVGATSIGLRGNSMSSPVGGDYAVYLADALKQELVLAGKLDPRSDVEISGVLLRNDIAAAGFGSASGEIEARLVVRRGGGAVRYEGAKRAEANWESSVVGAIAIPRAQQHYPVLVQKLIGQFLADRDFVEALK